MNLIPLWTTSPRPPWAPPGPFMMCPPPVQLGLIRLTTHSFCFGKGWIPQRALGFAPTQQFTSQSRHATLNPRQSRDYRDSCSSTFCMQSSDILLPDQFIWMYHLFDLVVYLSFCVHFVFRFGCLFVFLCALCSFQLYYLHAVGCIIHVISEFLSLTDIG